MFRFRRPRNEFFVDEAKIRIIISSDHEQTPTAASLQDDDQSSLKRGLYKYALQDLWSRAKLIFDRFPDMVRIPLTDRGDTALHVAVGANSRIFVQQLVNFMTPEDLETPNVVGNTTFCMAATAGNGQFLRIMIGKKEYLAVIPGQDGMLPVHLVALSGKDKIVLQLIAPHLLKRMDFKDIQRLFFMTISSSMYDVATELFENYPDKLAIGRDDQEQLTALHMLARKHSKFFYMQEGKNEEASSGRGHGLELFKRLWLQVSQLESNKFLELTTEPSAVLIEAAKSGNIEAVRWILYKNRELLTIKDSKERNLLHYAVFYRQRSIFNFLLKMETVDLIIGAVDKDGNNVLHLAAYKPKDASPSLTSDFEREILWFKEVEKTVPQLKKMKNIDEETPEEIFLNKYAEIIEEVKGSANRITQGGMVVATLTATIAFTAVLTAPGEKNNKWFIVFFLSNAVALFTSSASIVSFMLTFGSRLSKDESTMVRLRYVNIGRWLLFISIAAMIIAFVAASFLIFDHRSKWVAYVVASMVLLSTIFLVLSTIKGIILSTMLKIILLIGDFFRSRILFRTSPNKYQ